MKQILDVACGGRMFYFDPHNPYVLFCDKRTETMELCDGRKYEVNPDMECDFTALPFSDESYRMVVFDPPHLTSIGESSWMAKKYGRLSGNWKDMIRDGFRECFRVLKPGGTLVFKWNETDVPTSEILKLTDEKPVFGHKSGKRSLTQWIVFYKPEGTC